MRYDQGAYSLIVKLRGSQKMNNLSSQCLLPSYAPVELYKLGII